MEQRSVLGINSPLLDEPTVKLLPLACVYSDPLKIAFGVSKIVLEKLKEGNQTNMYFFHSLGINNLEKSQTTSKEKAFAFPVSLADPQI